MTNGRAIKWIVIASATLLLGACAGAPRQRPLPTKAIDEGPTTTSGARKQLEGRWALVSYSVTTADGRKADVDADGQLTFDGFGVMQMEYRLTDAGQKTLTGLGVGLNTPIISTGGNVVIDPQKHLITYTGKDYNQKLLSYDPQLAKQRANPFALERTREYSFSPDGTLTLRTRYENGKDAAVSVWKRGS
ncbi:MAG TPA: hypothetical protein VH436_16070 [Vicinamibacterales bacterium]|jgi:hypothetical protein